ncbi:mannose-6-phosphate isomerase, class I [Nesterenkonia xinjiangensis]|uniref:mannose-6-phosphate isomerase n=1 Tax=Nesterenkonia xinjiangensis TaxID=225327 RepID=A0A7Z0GMH2_9MICC|nr:mannose-6-phosphate isomerase, class I [Nesterenkonia xinjiangensis]NYJ78612.1 mannose-6-phosphate isomerase [Nesterenkonia xinjiangensis]
MTERLRLLRIDNDCMPYAWGAPGRISALLGCLAAPGPEAELWLGAHPRSPSRLLDADSPWADTREWEQATGHRLPFLLKILAAEQPLSLQAHPDAERAARGYAREEAAGVPADAPERMYRDPRPKPEMILALEDGFEALCGFRPVDELLGVVSEALAALPEDDASAPHRRALSHWLDQAERLQQRPGGIGDMGDMVSWLLSGESTSAAVVPALLHAADRLSVNGPAGHTGSSGQALSRLVHHLQRHHPGDPGIAVAVMLNHVTLQAGESLWLRAGVVHAYLQGLGIELMGPSDNVLRGGLTGKHIDVVELLQVAELAPGPAVPIVPQTIGAHQVAHGPAAPDSSPFELIEVTGQAAVRASGPSILVVLEGDLRITAGETVPPQGEPSEPAVRRRVRRGDMLLVTEAARLQVEGQGRAFLAVPRGEGHRRPSTAVASHRMTGGDQR